MWSVLAAAALAVASRPAPAFPPYRTTDADTAGERMLEVRLGLLKLQRRGVELFVKDVRSADTRAHAGIGVIAPLERLEIRTRLHIGLNDAAPDVEASVWLSWKWRIEREAP